MTSVISGCNLIPGRTVPRACDDRRASCVSSLVNLGLGRFKLRLERVTTGKRGTTAVRNHGRRVLDAICHVLILALKIPPARFSCMHGSDGKGIITARRRAPVSFLRGCNSAGLLAGCIVIVGSPSHRCCGYCRVTCSHRHCSKGG